jgi:hypothetical protein
MSSLLQPSLLYPRLVSVAVVLFLNMSPLDGRDARFIALFCPYRLPLSPPLLDEYPFMANLVLSMQDENRGRRVGNDAARMATWNSELFQIKYKSFLVQSGVAKNMLCRYVL